MIYVGNIVSELNSRLDAQGSDYYSFNQNYVQAINASIRFVISLIDKVAEENKLATELLSELQRVAVVTLSKYSRFTYDQSKMWSIRSINPLPLTESNGLPEVIQEDKKTSIVREDLVVIHSNYACGLLTKEEWELNSKNPFASGNTVIKCSSFKDGSADNVTFAYLSPYDYGMKVIDENDNLISLKEIEIRPYIPNRNVAVYYIEPHKEILLEDEYILLHSKLEGFIIEKCLQYISYQQGDETNIFTLSQSEIKSIYSLLI